MTEELKPFYVHTGEGNNALSIAKSEKASNGGWIGASVATMVRSSDFFTQDDLNDMAQRMVDALNTRPAAGDAVEDEPVLPCHLKVGTVRFRRGVKVSTAQIGIDRLAEAYRQATQGKSISELLADTIPSREGELREALKETTEMLEALLSQLHSWGHSPVVNVHYRIGKNRVALEGK